MPASDHHVEGHDLNHAHAHRHVLRGRAFEVFFAVSMLFGRGAMARTVTELTTLSRSDVVVDVGCGPGTAVRRAERDGAGRAVGVDPSRQMLRLAEWISSARRMHRVGYVQGSAEGLPLDKGTATVVWALQSVHHWEDRRRGLQESLRVLEPRGRLIILERSAEPGARGHKKHGLTADQAEDVASLAAQTGFAEVATRTVRIGRRGDFTVITASAPSV